MPLPGGRFPILHAGFVLTGVVTTLLGPILPLLAARWTLNDWQAGLLFTMQFAGSMTGVALSGAGMTRLGFRPTLVGGTVLMAVGVAVLGVAPMALGYGAVFCYGVGLGLTIPSTNIAVAARHPERRASALNLLNLAWGIGAVSAPPAVAALQRTGRGETFLFALAAALAATAAAVGRTRFAEDGTAHASTQATTAWWSPGVLLAGAMLFVYVGTETSLAGWVALYAQRLDLVTAARAVAAPSVFWAALLLGRAVAPLVLRTVRDVRLVGWSLAVATAGVSLLLVAGSAPALAVAVAVAGLGLSVVFPVTVALFTRDYERESARLAGPVFALAGLGGATLPSLVGVVSAQAGSLKAGLVVPWFGCLIMLALHAARARLAPRAPAE